MQMYVYDHFYFVYSRHTINSCFVLQVHELSGITTLLMQVKVKFAFHQIGFKNTFASSTYPK